jgi:hypothetical protein
MKRVVMAVLMFGIASCAVEAGPATTSTSADEETTKPTSSELTSSPLDHEVAPRGIDCGSVPNALCETVAQCRVGGGLSKGACIVPAGTICCVRNTVDDER